MTTNPVTGSEPNSLRKPMFLRQKISSLWLLAVFVALIIFFSAANPAAFLSTYNLQNVVADAATLLILAVGMTFVIATAGIDLSVGAVLLLSEIVAVKVMILFGGQGWTASILGTIAGVSVGAACGAFNGFLTGVLRIPSMIGTLGTLGMATGAGLLLTDGANIRSGVPDLITRGIGSSQLFGVVPAVALVAFVIVLIAGFVLKRTRFGTHVLGLGSNEKALSRCGISTAALHVKVFTISGACAGLGGIIDLARFTTTTVGGHSSDALNAITAVVLGGTSLFGGVASIFGTVVGVFVPAILSNGLVMINLQSFWQQIAVGAVLIIAIYIDQGRRNKA